jgi:undecaprenyl-diphosphatase
VDGDGDELAVAELLGVAAGEVSASVGWGPTAIATAVSFATYASIAWILRLLASHSISVFVGYRLGLAVVVGTLLATGLLSCT